MNLLFLHGAGVTGRTWQFQKKVFGEHYVELHEDGGRRSIEEYADFLKAYADGRNLEDVVPVGHSMGGAIALMFALKYSAKRLILVGTGSRLRVAPEIMKILKDDYEAACRMILEYAFAPGSSDSLKAASLKEMLSIPQHVTLSDFLACDAFDVTERLSEIDVPTLIICGTQDRLTPPKYSRFLEENMKGSRLRLIEDAGHMVMMEKPDRFNSALKEFLEVV